MDFLLKKIIITLVTDYSMDLKFITHTNIILSERRRWGEFTSPNWIETVGQLAEDVKVTSHGGPGGHVSDKRESRFITKLETICLK